MLRRLVMAAACLLLSVQLGTADEKTKGKLSIWLGYPETLDAFKLGQAEFKKKYPNVDVEILTFELREFEAKLRSRYRPEAARTSSRCTISSSRAISRAARSPTCRPISRRS